MSRSIDLLTSAPDDVLRQLFQTFRLERESKWVHYRANKDSAPD